jgi:hypothetical protein
MEIYLTMILLHGPVGLLRSKNQTVERRIFLRSRTRDHKISVERRSIFVVFNGGK